MNQKPFEIAGNHGTDDETALCIKELGPVVDRLVEKRIAPASIVRTLTELSVRTICHTTLKLG